MNDLYRMMAVRYSSLAGGACVYTLNYRLWPQYPYPSQQNDAMDAWFYLTGGGGLCRRPHFRRGRQRGGNLALSLTLRLRDEGRELPAGIVAMSPWADLSNSGPSHLYNATKDPSFGVEPDQWDGSHARGRGHTYPDGLNAKTPYLSPSFGDYAGFPPHAAAGGGPGGAAQRQSNGL